MAIDMSFTAIAELQSAAEISIHAPRVGSDLSPLECLL